MTKTNKVATKKRNIKKEVDIEKKEPPKEEVREISPKNYFILLGIFILSLATVVGLRYWYNAYQEYELKTSVLKDKLTEVTITELDTYLAENADAILYIEVTEDENSREIGKDLTDVIKKRELTSEAVYLSLSSVEDKEKFVEDFNKKYSTSENTNVNNYPALILFKDGKIEAYVSRTEKQRLNIGNVEQLFDEYELEGE